jgi:hypothetical protein
MDAKVSAAARARGKLQVDEDELFQHRTWIVQRVGWTLLLAVLIASALGGLGPGLLGRSTAGSPETGLWIEYERIGRRDSPTSIALHIERRLVAGDRLHLVLGGDYLRGAELESLLPRPSGGGAAPQGGVLAFDLHGGGEGMLRFALQVKFTEAGVFRGEIGLLGGPTLKVSHWIYP